VLRKVGVLVDRSDRRFLRRHVMHRDFRLFRPHYSLERGVRPANSEVTKRGALEDQRLACGVDKTSALARFDLSKLGDRHACTPCR